MPAPKKPNTAAATAVVRRRGQETMAAKLRDAGWLVVPPPSEPNGQAIDGIAAQDAAIDSTERVSEKVNIGPDGFAVPTYAEALAHQRERLAALTVTRSPQDIDGLCLHAKSVVQTLDGQMAEPGGYAHGVFDALCYVLGFPTTAPVTAEMIGDRLERVRRRA